MVTLSSSDAFFWQLADWLAGWLPGWLVSLFCFGGGPQVIEKQFQKSFLFSEHSPGLAPWRGRTETQAQERNWLVGLLDVFLSEDH